MLKAEFREFLGAFKNAESLSPELQAAIAVDTGLETLVRAAVADGRAIIIAGSAGSGKTHLVRSVMKQLSEEYQLIAPRENGRGPHVMVVQDATELDVGERLEVIEDASRSRVATIVAINEGPLLEAARLEGSRDKAGTYSEALTLLRSARHGILRAFEAEAPTVIDMGAFDPLDRELVAKVLDLELLRETAAESECDCDPMDCPRRLAWKQLSSADVRTRVGAVLGLVNVLEREWLFRDLWDFMADLVLGGSCDDDPPSSPWFWRVFYGESRLSRSLRELVAPEDIPLPGVDARIFYADWGSAQLRAVVDGVELIPVTQAQQGSEFAPFRYMKAQALFVLRDIDLAMRALQTVKGSFRGLLERRQVGPVLRVINEYFAFNLRPGSETVLDLFVEHGVERRTEHTSGVVKLGEANASEFELRRPQVIANHPDDESREGAGGYYLVHRDTKSSLRVDGERLRLLQRGRTPRSADREQVDLDWDLCQFFEGILRLKKWERDFVVVKCDFSRLSADELRYRVSAAPAIIEEG